MAPVPLSPELVGMALPETTWSWGWRDAVLYALGIGARPGDGALVDATPGFVELREIADRVAVEGRASPLLLVQQLRDVLDRGFLHCRMFLLSDPERG